MMGIFRYRNGLLLLSVWLLAACSGSAQVQVVQQFPNVVFEPRPVNVALVFNEEFRNYRATPAEEVSIAIGTAQVDSLTKAFQGMFSNVTTHQSSDDLPLNTELVITPSVQEVQLSTPSDSYLNVYEVWIKFNLEIATRDGVPVDSWFMPAYGKTPDSFMLSRSEAIHEAAVVALRDASAKLVLDFFRIPSVYSWMEQQQKL